MSNNRNIILTQNEFEILHSMEKIKKDDIEYKIPYNGKINIPIVSQNNKEEFLLDISRRIINLKKVKYQNRCRKCIPLIRLDINSSHHRNPDNQEIDGTHLHIYREGYGLGSAYELDKINAIYSKEIFQINENIFKELDNMQQTLLDFIEYCNIVEKPIFSFDDLFLNMYQ